MTADRLRSACLALSLALAALLGIRAAFDVTPLTSQDESLHFRRAVQLSEGGPFPSHLGPNDWGGPIASHPADLATWLDALRNAGRAVPRQAYRAEAAAIAHTTARPELASFPSTASYAPLLYAGQAIGLAAVGTFDPNPADQLLAGRLGGLALALLLAASILALLPFGRVAVLMILTTPTAIVLWASYSADPLTTGLPLLFVATVLRLRQRPDLTLSRKALAGLALLAIGLGLLKLTAALLSLAVLLLPGSRFATPRRAAFAKALIVGLALGVALAWNLRYPFNPGRYWHSGADPARTVSLLLAHPFLALSRLGWNAVHRAREFWITGYSAFGGGPSPYLFLQNGPTVGLAALLALAAAFCDPPRRSDRMVASLLILLGLAYAAETMLAFLVGYTPTGWTFITGLQGRYFLVSFAFVLLGLASLAPVRPSRIAMAAAPLLLGWMLLDVRSIDALLRAYRPLFR